MLFRLNYSHCPVEKQSADALLQPEKGCPLELFPLLVHPALPDRQPAARCELAVGFPAAAVLCNTVRMLHFGSSCCAERLLCNLSHSFCCYFIVHYESCCIFCLFAKDLVISAWDKCYENNIHRLSKGIVWPRDWILMVLINLIPCCYTSLYCKNAMNCPVVLM